MMLALLLAADALIWNGGKTKEEAEAQFPAWRAAQSLLESGGVKPLSEYPKLVRSDDISGLKSGFYIWLIGVCDSNGDKVLDVVKTLFPGAYKRKVKAPPSCPSFVDKGFKRGPNISKTLLTYQTTDEEPGDEEGRFASWSRTDHHVVLMAGNTIADVVTIAGGEQHSYGMSDGGGGYTCAATAFTLKGKTISFSRTCRAASGECGSYLTGIESTKITVSDTLSADTTKRESNYVQCGD